MRSPPPRLTAAALPPGLKLRAVPPGSRCCQPAAALGPRAPARRAGPGRGWEIRCSPLSADRDIRVDLATAV